MKVASAYDRESSFRAFLIVSAICACIAPVQDKAAGHLTPGSRFDPSPAEAVVLCALCHQPQNADPDTGNSLNAKVMLHKIHMGSQLPSVNGYTSGGKTIPPKPNQIIGFMSSVNDFSTVIDPDLLQTA